MELTQEQIERQDFVDNAIDRLLNDLVPDGYRKLYTADTYTSKEHGGLINRQFDWDISMIADIRCEMEKVIRYKLDIDGEDAGREKRVADFEMAFYPFLDEDEIETALDEAARELEDGAEHTPHPAISAFVDRAAESRGVNVANICAECDTEYAAPFDVCAVCRILARGNWTEVDINTNERGNDVLRFTSNVNSENSCASTSLGTHRSEMKLYRTDGGVPRMIEWVVGDEVAVEHVGLVVDGLKVVDYDGVFEIPEEVCDWLEYLGYDCAEVRDSE